MILPSWTILCLRKVSKHPFKNIQLGRTSLGLLSIFRKLQYWFCSSCKLWERHIWALLWCNRNDLNSPLIIFTIRSFFSFLALIFLKTVFIFFFHCPWVKTTLFTCHFSLSALKQCQEFLLEILCLLPKRYMVRKQVWVSDLETNSKYPHSLLLSIYF